MSEQDHKQPSKSRVLAGVLELILGPGVGHAYVGATSAALVWFLAHLALLFALPFVAWGVFIFLILRVAAVVSVVRIARSKRSAENLPAAQVVRSAPGTSGLAVVLALASIASFVALRAYWVEGFVIPTTGMAPTFVPGDYVTSFKAAYLFGDPERGEMIVFEEPCNGHSYIMRVVAVAGDEVSVVCDRVFLNRKPLALELLDKREAIIETNDSGRDGTVSRELVHARETIGDRSYVVGFDSALSGDSSRPVFPRGPSELPSCPHTMAHPAEVRALPPSAEDCQPSFGYVVPDDHLFVLGDNRDDSFDSREWGPVPVDAIVGRATVRWYSRSPEGRIRWDRIGSVE